MAKEDDADNHRALRVKAQINAVEVLPNFIWGFLQTLAKKLGKQDKGEKSRTNNANVECRVNESLLATLEAKVEKQEEGEKPRTNANVDCRIIEASAATSTLTLVQQPTAGQNSHFVTKATDPPDAEQKEQQIIHSKFGDYLHIRPSAGIIWSGGFQILDSGKPYSVFHAQLPSRINKKAHELSENMPLMLQVKLVPRHKLWTDLFPQSRPDLCHVALYFFPSDTIKSSKEDFASLFELMESQNSVMLSCIGGVRLMIFTSKQLRPDAQDFIKKIKTDCFLCGVFHHTKNGQIVREEHVELPSLGSVPDLSSNIDDNMAADMEIDEVGGEVSGRDEDEPLQVIKVKPDGVNLSLAPCSQNAIHWTPPAAGWIKLNVEGCFDENRGFSTAAGLIRDDSGKWVFGYSFNVSDCDRLVAEMHALYQGIRTLWDSGYRKVLVESSSNEAVEYIESQKTHILITESCRDLLNRDWRCQVSYIDQQENLCANWLATHPQDRKEVILFSKPPLELLPIYRNDCSV